MEKLNFGGRLWVALILPWRVLFSATYGARINNLDALVLSPGEAPTGEKEEFKVEASKSSKEKSKAKEDDIKASEAKASEAKTIEAEADTTAALQLLAILQREGRFIDFLQEEMGSFSDDEIGAAARVVQEGCKNGLKEYVELEAIRKEEEGDSVKLEKGYNAAETRVTGNVSGEPPFQGTLAHHGWRVKKIQLPKLSADHDAHVVAPAEVEL